MTRIVSLAALALVGCAGAPPLASSAALPESRQPEPVVVSPAFPFALSALAPQFAPSTYAVGRVFALDGDRTLYVNVTGIGVLGPDGTVLRTELRSFENADESYFDRSRGRVLAPYWTFDVRDGSGFGLDELVRLGCSRDAATCLVEEEDSAAGVVRISLVETANDASVASAPLTWEAFGVDVPHDERGSMFFDEGSVKVDGRVAAFTASRSDELYLCVLESASGAGARCRRLEGARVLVSIDADRGIARFVQDTSGEFSEEEEYAEEEEEEAAEGDDEDAGAVADDGPARTLADGESQLYDLRTLTPLERPVPPRSPSLGPEPLAVEEYFETHRVVVAATGELVYAPSSMGTRSIAGSGAFATIDETTVRFFDASAHETGSASLAEPFDPADSITGALASGALHVVASMSGLAVIHPGDSAVRFSPLREDYGFVVSNERGTFVLRSESAALALGAAGLVSDVPAAPEPESRTNVAAARRGFALTIAPRHPRVRMLAMGGLGAARGLFAYVDGRQVHVADAEGNDVVRPTRLPRSVDPNVCSSFAFLTDVDVVLSGRAPCVPTRIRFRARRTSPLGLAHVRFDATRDGSRVALVADHRLYVLDGATGATLGELDPGLAHPREVHYSDSESRIVINGEDGWVIVDAATLGTGAGASAPRVGRVVDGTRGVYDAENDLVVRDLDERNLELVPVFGGDATSLPMLDADGAPSLEFLAGEVRSMPGFLAFPRSREVTFVRLRDRATLRLLVRGSRVALVVAWVEGDQVRDVVPSASPLLRVRGAVADAIPLPVPPSTGALDRALGAFFGGATESN